MKLLALFSPCAVLPALWLLQRLEVWVDVASGPRDHPRILPAARNAPEPVRRRVTEVSRG